MLNIKSLTSGLTAAALVSVIGLAYAQTTTTPPTTRDNSPAMTATPMTPAPTDMTTPGTSPSSTTSPTQMNNEAPNGTMTEPAPKADRN